MPKPKKKVISPGQGLLLLIDHYKNDPIKVDKLKKLYLSGAETTADAEEIKALLKDPVLSSYKVSFEATTINEDATRRYFETHLAYESLTHGLSKIDHSELKAHVDNLYAMIPADEKAGIEHVLRGEFRPQDNNLFKEYADYINRIRTKEIFPELSAPEREKIELLAKSSFLGVVNAWYTPMPLNIYGTGIYSEANKGKESVIGQDSTRNQNLGIMKGHMPIALNDIARSDKEIPYLKPSDQAAFVEHAQWVESNFSKMVHPFSNSISGTMLCQLRASAKLRDEGHGVFTDSGERMGQFSQLLVSAMLFNSGGHTLNEFTAPMSLNSVRDEFRTTPSFDKINLESMFFTNNEEAFDKALQDAVDYNSTILQRDNLHAQIESSERVEPKNKVLAKFQMTPKLNRLSELVSHRKEDYENQLRWKYSTKNRLLQTGLDKVIKHMDNGNLFEAQNAVTQLKQDFLEKIGEENLRQSKSFSLITSVERELARIQNEFEFLTAKLENKYVLKELAEPPQLVRNINEGEDELTVRARSRLKSVKGLNELTSLDRKNKAIDKAYMAYASPRDEKNENQVQYEQRVQEARDILLEKLMIKKENFKTEIEINQQIMMKMATRLEEYRQSLFTRGRGTVAERLDKAWVCYNDETRTMEDRVIAQSYLIFVLDIKDDNIIGDLNITLQKLMLERALLKDKNPEYIPGKSPIALGEESKGKLKKTEVPGASDDPVVTDALKEKNLLDVNADSRKKDSGEATGQKTEFFDAKQRDMFQVLIRQDKFVTPEGELFDTSDSISKDKKGFAAFTLNVNGELSLFQHRFQEVNGVAHSSMNNAMPVFCAGEVRIENGKLLTITDRSGHYAPTLYNLYKALDYFKKQGVDISETKVYCSKRPSEVLNIDFHKSKDFPQFYEINAKELCNSYSVHLNKVVQNIQSELAAYQAPSFKKFLYKVKDFFMGTNLTKEQEVIAKQLAEKLSSLSEEISSANSLSSLKTVNDKIDQLLENADKENEKLNAKYKKNGSHLTQSITHYREELGKITGRLKSAIKTKEEMGLNDEDILSSSEQLKK